MVEAETAEVSNPYWEEFERSGDAPAYAKSYSAFVRAFAESTLQQHLFAGAEASPEKLSGEFFRRLESAIAPGFCECG
ncbi:MAG: hypothetical protein ABI839_05970 [Verrucomicrobiota bacterium]